MTICFLSLQVDRSIAFEIMMAANYLDIDELINTAGKAIAKLIKGKKPSEIRRNFDIEDDFTQAEKAEIRRQKAWCEMK